MTTTTAASDRRMMHLPYLTDATGVLHRRDCVYASDMQARNLLAAQDAAARAALSPAFACSACVTPGRPDLTDGPLKPIPGNRYTIQALHARARQARDTATRGAPAYEGSRVSIAQSPEVAGDPDVLAFTAAASLLTCHDETGIDLTVWPEVRAWVEYVSGVPVDSEE